MNTVRQSLFHRFLSRLGNFHVFFIRALSAARLFNRDPRYLSGWIPVSGTGWIVLLLVCLTAPCAASERGVVIFRDEGGQDVGMYDESHALLVGVSDYRRGWPRLPGVKKDLVAVRQALQRHGFKVHVKEDLADKDELERAFEEFIIRHGLAEQNRLLFYFAGHGHTHKPPYADSNDPEEWMGYIVARDAPFPETDLPGFLRHAVSMERFEELSKQIEAKHALFVFDSCFSGSVFALSRSPRPQSITYKTARPVRQFITSGSADETVPDVSLFRRQLVAALAGEADGNGDGYVTGAELGDFLQNTVINYTHSAQHPQYGKIRHPRLDKGDFVFSLASAAPIIAGPGADSDREPERTDGRSEIQPAMLTVRSNVHGDMVYIDGRKMGSTRLDVELPPGVHTVRVEKPGYFPEEETLELMPGQPRVLRVTLRARTKKAAPSQVQVKEYRCNDCLATIIASARGVSTEREVVMARMMAERKALKNIEERLSQVLSDPPYSLEPTHAADVVDEGEIMEVEYGRLGSKVTAEVKYRLKVPNVGEAAR